MPCMIAPIPVSKEEEGLWKEGTRMELYIMQLDILCCAVDVKSVIGYVINCYVYYRVYYVIKYLLCLK